MLRAIREVKPSWVVGENVYGLLNWSEGLVFEEVQTDLEKEGYTVQPVILPACGVNAPHKRERIWFVAYTQGPNKQRDRLCKKREKRKVGGSNSVLVSYASSIRLRRQGNRFRKTRLPYQESKENYWKNFPTQPPICGGDDGLPTQLDGITLPKWRNESIKGFGNAIVPQVAYEIFKAIDKMNSK
jgi:DNA (cytosine-5)-methyltransferase 1